MKHIFKIVILAFALISTSSASFAQTQGRSAYPLLQPLAVNGDLNAQKILSNMFLKGSGVEQNYADALTWAYVAELNPNFNDAELLSEKIIPQVSQHDLNEASYNVGFLYNSGRILPKNPQKAIEWFEKGAEHNFNPSLHSLGRIYMDEQGIDKDLDKAREYLLVAAKSGDIESQVFMGISYIHNGIVYDNYKAYKWFTIAIGNGFEDDTGLQKATIKDLSEEQIEKANAEAAAWNAENMQK